MKILSSPSASACSFTRPEPGTIIALTLALTVLPSTTRGDRAQVLDAAVGAGADEHAVERDVGDLLAALEAHVVERASSAARRLFSSAISAGTGTRPVIEITCSGLVPQVTSGGSFAASSLISRSKCAPSSERSVSQ